MVFLSFHIATQPFWSLKAFTCCQGDDPIVLSLTMKILASNLTRPIDSLCIPFYFCVASPSNVLSSTFWGKKFFSCIFSELGLLYKRVAMLCVRIV